MYVCVLNFDMEEVMMMREKSDWLRDLVMWITSPG